MKIIHTLVGIVMLFAMVFAVDCLPGMSKTPQHPHALGDAGIAVCAPEAVPALLCQATTKTSPAHECAICPDPARHCFTSTSVYCVSTGCDDSVCEKRERRK